MRRILRVGVVLVVLLLPACTRGGGTVPTHSPTPTGDSPSPSATTLPPGAPVIVGFKNDQPNLSQLLDSESRPTGFEPDLAQTVLAEALGFKLTPSPVSTRTWADQLRNGQVRVVVSAISYTSARNKEFLFAGPYLQTRLGIMVAKDSPLSDREIAELKGLKVCYIRATTAEPAVEQLVKNNPAVIPVPQDTATRCLEDIRSNPDEVFVSDGIILRGQSTATPGKDLYRFVEHDIGSAPQKYAIALRSDDGELCLRIANALDRYLGSPQWFANFNSWFGPAGGDRALLEQLYKPPAVERKWCAPPSSQG
ncbi:transporter substrate-binding domain-containing protein [Kitasatospora sp. NPDC096147]|uniref:transporter substrate-binding domain-containing protein n=1 Tax=Kitasatospora sp. NPDC096147 TaxID=3364093 RepID=UPI0038152933